MGDEVIIIRCSISTNKVGSKCEDDYEYPREFWDELDAEGKRDVLDAHLADHERNNSDKWAVALDADGKDLSLD